MGRQCAPIQIDNTDGITVRNLLEVCFRMRIQKFEDFEVFIGIVVQGLDRIDDGLCLSVDFWFEE